MAVRKPPFSLLPPESQPWGRLLLDSADSVSQVLDAELLRQQSTGSTFSSQADNLSTQISGLRAATIVKSVIPGFSVFVPYRPLDAPRDSIFSPTIFINPPDRNSLAVRVIANFSVSDTANGSLTSGSQKFISAGSSTARGDAGGAALRLNPMPDQTSLMIYSTVTPGLAVPVQVALTAKAYSTASEGNMVISDINITTVFYGAIR